MSIASEILRLQNSKKSLKTWLEKKGYQIADERLDELIELAKKAVGGIDTSDATATSLDILLGKTAYVNDELVEGTIETYDYSVDEGGDSFPEVVIPQVKNIIVDEKGILNFEAPNLTDFQKYNPTISYIINVNGTELTTTITNNINISFYLIDGDNEISIITKAILNDTSEDKKENAIYSLPTQYVHVLPEKMPYKFYHTTPVLYGDYIYLFGFGGNQNISSKILKFDYKNKTIETLSTTIPYGGWGSERTAVLVDKTIYLFGAYRGGGEKAIYKFDVESETLTTLSITLPRTEYFMKYGRIDNKIYLLSRSTTDVYLFDIETENITILEVKQPLVETRNILQENWGCQIGNNIYMMGSYQTFLKRYIYIFDMSTETFTLIKEETENLELPYRMGCCVNIGNKIYFFGGSGNQKNSNGSWSTNSKTYPYIFEFDIETLNFKKLDIELWITNNGNFSNSYCSIDDGFYIFGGTGGNANDYITKVKV